MRKKTGFFIFLITLVIIVACSNDPQTNRIIESEYLILDSMSIVGGAQYIAKTNDTNWLAMYNFGYKKLSANPDKSVIGFLYHVPDSLKFKRNGALPEGYANKLISLFKYDSLYNNFVLIKYQLEK